MKIYIYMVEILDLIQLLIYYYHKKYNEKY